MNSPFLYTTKGSLFLNNDGKSSEIPSQYLQNYKKNMLQINRKKEWKQKSDLTLMGRYSSPQEDESGLRHQFTGATFIKDSAILYAISVENSAGMFKTREGIGENSEGHIVHTTNRQFNSPNYSPAFDELVYSTREQDGTENLHSLNLTAESERELTEGDSLDANPRWDISGKKRVVYQSAGIGRDSNNNFALLGPYGINILDFESQDILELSYSHSYDYIFPVLNGDQLYAIRRPYESGRRKSSFTPLDLLLIPVNIVRTLFSWINFNSMIFRGKPLANGMNVKDPQIDKKLFIHGRLVDAQKALKAAEKKGDTAPSLVPRSWVLVSIDRDGADTVLEEGVITFDVTQDGTIIFSNGSAVFQKVGTAKKELLFKKKWVERIITPR